MIKTEKKNKECDAICEGGVDICYLFPVGVDRLQITEK